MNSRKWMAQIAVSFIGRTQTTVLLTDSVSSDGVVVRTDAPPSPMTLLRMELLLPPDGESLVVDATVANGALATEGHAGRGVELGFFARSDQGTAYWNRFIDYVEKAHPESVERPVMLAQEGANPSARRVIVDFDAADVTPGGVFVATRQSFALGTRVHATVIDKSSREQCELDCVVRRRVTRGRQGIGLECRDRRGATWSDLAAFLDTRARALRVEIETMRAPLPVMMETQPWASSDAVEWRPRGEDSWSVPPGNGW